MYLTPQTVMIRCCGKGLFPGEPRGAGRENNNLYSQSHITFISPGTRIGTERNVSVVNIRDCSDDTHYLLHSVHHILYCRRVVCASVCSHCTILHHKSQDGVGHPYTRSAVCIPYSCSWNPLITGADMNIPHTIITLTLHGVSQTVTKHIPPESPEC